ncbi:hypothetical protein FRC02_002839 [Tulasnella sp. 418]|nr:hypothetical protein FRC02_002839 [Tulasnella sp. 418]
MLKQDSNQIQCASYFHHGTSLSIKPRSSTVACVNFTHTSTRIAFPWSDGTSTDLEELREPPSFLRVFIQDFSDTANNYVDTLLGRKDELFVLPSEFYRAYVASPSSPITLRLPTTRNIFTYDFIALTINVNNNHWILALICHIPQLNPDFIGDRQSSIIIFDSLGHKYSGVVKGLKNIILKRLPIIANDVWQPVEAAVKAMPTYYPSVRQIALQVTSFPFAHHIYTRYRNNRILMTAASTLPIFLEFL